MLIRNLDAVISDFDDKPIMGPGGKPFTLRAAIIGGLMHESPQEPGKQPTTGEQRFNLWSIANKVKLAHAEVDLPVEDVASIKAKVGEAYLAIIVGPVWSMIESPAAEEAAQ